MSYRVTGAEVKKIFDTTMEASELDVFIKTANVMINNNTELLALSSDVLDEIELWLAAHFAASKDQRITYQSYQESKVKFQGNYGMGLEATDYGQRAMELDTTGTLRNSKLSVATINAYPMSYPDTYATSENWEDA